MKKLITALAGLLFLASPAFATNYDYTAQVYKKTVTNSGDVVLTEVTSGITYKVLTINSDTAATITAFADDTATAKTNPVTTTVFATDDVVKFRSTASSHDLIVTDTAGMYTAFVEGFTPQDHKIVIDEMPNVMHEGVIWFGASDNSETDTTVDFLYDTYIENVIVEVTANDSTETLNVGLLSSGTGGDADGFAAAVPMTIGFYNPKKVAWTTVSGGANSKYISTVTYPGALIGVVDAGNDSPNSNPGVINVYGHIVKGADETQLTYTGSAGSDTAAGYIHVFHTRMR